MGLTNFKQMKGSSELLQRIAALEQQVAQGGGGNGGGQGTDSGSVVSGSSKDKFSELLYAKNWTNQKYTVTNAKIKADSDIFMSCHAGTSSQVYKMFGEACIACSEQKDGSFTLIAYGATPEQDVIVDFLIL